MGPSSVRVLVVDDYEPWHSFITATLQREPKLQIIGHVFDGLNAVEQAEQLQPDLILLDIGLPHLNGIAAARRIQEVSPQSKILFASENRSPDIVKAALHTGVSGYVLKSDAGSELLPAVRAVLEGQRFVSASLSGRDLSGLDDQQPDTHRLRDDGEMLKPVQNMGTSRDHEVAFYSDDRGFLEHVTRFVEAALNAGNAAVVLATESHRKNLLSELRERGPEVRTALEEGRYFALDAEETLSTFVANGVLDPFRFLELFGDVLMTARETAKGEHPHVSVFGEAVHLLWAQGNAEAAMQLEKLGNELTKIHDVDILCGYSLGSVEIGMDHHLFRRVCAEHSAVYSQ